MKKYVTIYIALFILISCKEKKDAGTDSEPPISAVSIIKGQINHLDTSFYLIQKIESMNSKNDTLFLKREEIRIFAKPFIDMPDITSANLIKNYNEERIIDESQNVLSITYTAKDELAEIQKQIIIINLDELASGRVQSIFIDRNLTLKDTILQQKMYWELDNYFTIGEIIQKENLPEQTRLTKIIWQ